MNLSACKAIINSQEPIECHQDIPDTVELVSSFRIPHPFSTVASYSRAFYKYYNRLPKFCLYDREKMKNHHAGVCYIIKEAFHSKKYPNITSKFNKYILCPYCDPFERIKNALKNGQPPESVEDPKFHDTLKSSFIHHVANAHGITPSGTAMPQPFVGITKSEPSQTQSPGQYTLICICPLNISQHDKSPCLAQMQLNIKQSNPFKTYFRHVATSHIYQRKNKSQLVYQPIVEDANGLKHHNHFVPLSNETLNKALKTLHEKCGPAVNPISICTDIEVVESALKFIERKYGVVAQRLPTTENIIRVNEQRLFDFIPGIEETDAISVSITYKPKEANKDPQVGRKRVINTDTANETSYSFEQPVQKRQKQSKKSDQHLTLNHINKPESEIAESVKNTSLFNFPTSKCSTIDSTQIEHDVTKNTTITSDHGLGCGSLNLNNDINFLKGDPTLNNEIFFDQNFFDDSFFDNPFFNDSGFYNYDLHQSEKFNLGFGGNFFS